jgi:hypothetical protein
MRSVIRASAACASASSRSLRGIARVDIELEGEMDGDWDNQALPLLNATTFGAMYLARGKQEIMPFLAECSLMEGIEVPC